MQEFVLFPTVEYFPVWTYHNLLIHFPVKGTMSYFQFRAFTKGLLRTRVPVGIGGQDAGSGCAVGKEGAPLSFPDLCVYQFTLPPVVWDLPS